MPTNRRRVIRSRKETIELDQATVDCLLFGTNHELRRSRFFDDGQRLREVWEQHKEALLREWRKRGHSGLPWALAWINKDLAGMQEAEEAKVVFEQDTSGEEAVLT